MTRSCIGLLIALLALTLSHSPARACLAIGRTGPVQVKGEEALIVWDAAHQTEHFYRQAHFEGVPEEFGFLRQFASHLIASCLIPGVPPMPEA